MKNVTTITVGVALLEIVLLFVGVPLQAQVSPPPAAIRPPTTPFRGMVLQVQALDDLPAYEKAVDQIADLGADSILITLHANQENGQSSVIYTDFRNTPTPEKLGQLIDHCRQKHLRVGLMPVVILSRPHGQEWRGKIKPESWSAWFESYRQMIDLFADIGQSHGAELLVVGSELTSSESNGGEWTTTIGSARDRFKGSLTYAANWDHFANIEFWDQLDAIGMNAYYTLGDGSDVTTEQVIANWKPIKQHLISFAGEKNRPLIFLEVGWCSLSNAAKDPWDYTQTELPADNELQRKLYDGFLESWHGEPALAGYLIHEWIPGDPAPKEYTPQGKPAEKVLRDYLSKPTWKIRVRSDRE